MPSQLSDDWFERERLHFAARKGDIGSVMELIAGGFDVNEFDDLGKTPLHYAVENEHFEVVVYLLRVGANVNAHHEPTIGNTPLADVAESCSLRMAKLLVSEGADPDIPGWMQLTALHRSAKRKREEGISVHELLLEASKRGHS